MAFLVFLFFSLLCLSSSSAISRDRTISNLDLAKFNTKEQVSSLFQLWKMEHGRVYKNQEEEAKRLEIFQNNLNYIRDMNAKRKSPHSHTLGLNKFADITHEEFSRMYLQVPKYVSLPINKANEDKDPEEEQKQEQEQGQEQEQEKQEQEQEQGQEQEQEKEEQEQEQEKEELGSCEDAPESWDWREKGVITEVKYQGQCGSGWAFSATGAIEAINAITTGNLVSLSEQELIDCVEQSDGCYNGWPYQSFEWVIKNGGIASEADYPYKAKDGRCKANKIQKKVTIDGYNTIQLSNQSTLREADIAKSLLCATLKQPISVSIDGKGFHLYTGGIYDGENCKSPYGINHFVLIVGYGSENGVDYWIAKNSWGKDWGKDGYIWIQRNKSDVLGVCGMNYFASYPTKESPKPLVSARVKGGPRVDYSTL